LSTAGGRRRTGERHILAALQPGVDEPEDVRLAVIEGEECWQYHATGPMELKLFTMAEQHTGPCALFYQAALKTTALHGYAWLQMQVRVNGVDYFSRGSMLHESVSGDQDWTRVEIPFFLKRGQVADTVTLQLVVNGPGKVRIKDVSLVRETDKLGH
jgi:hypothetical protein